MNKQFIYLLVFIFLLIPLTCFAHKISAFVDVEGNKITVYSYFNDGTPIKHGEVDVYNEDTNRLVLKGKTNEQGEFTFTVPAKANYKIVVTAELGHRAVAYVKEDEITIERKTSSAPVSGKEKSGSKESLKTTGKATKKVSNQSQASSEAPQKQEITTSLKTIAYSGISKAELEKVVRKVVKEELKAELKPLRMELLSIEEAMSKPSLRDIIGGLGWVLGIFGAAGLILSRRNK